MENTKVRRTKRDYFEAMLKIIKDNEYSCPIDELIEFCEKEIKAIDDKKEKAKEKNKEVYPHLEQELLVILMKDKFLTADQILPNLTGEGLTKNKIVYRLTKLFNKGLITKENIVIEDEETGKKKKSMGYKLV